MPIVTESITRHKTKFYDFNVHRLAASPLGPFERSDIDKLIEGRFWAPKAIGVALEILLLPNVTAVEGVDKTTNSGIKLTNAN